MEDTIYSESTNTVAMSTSKDLEFARPQNHERHRKKRGKSHAGLTVASRPFAGRIGGNQEFTVSADDASFTRIPDAAPSFSWAQSFYPSAFTDVELWKESIIEGVGTCLQVYLSGLVSVGLGPLVLATGLGPVAPAAFGSIFTGTLIALFIFGAGPGYESVTTNTIRMFR